MSTLCLHRFPTEALLEMSHLQADKVKVLTWEWCFSKIFTGKKKAVKCIKEKVMCLNLFSGVT